MKEIYTSYFARLPKIKQEYGDYALVNIATGFPNFLDSSEFENMSELNPGWTLVNKIKRGEIGWDEYVLEYNAMLESLDFNKIYEKLPDKCVLFCYEKATDNCHRHLVADWITKNSDSIVSELTL